MAQRSLTREDLRMSLKARDAWWTVLVIDPIAARILPVIYPIAWITPMRLTLFAGAIGLLPGLFFLDGALVFGAVAFQIRFLIDCLDGKLARLRHSSSTMGRLVDSVFDTVVLCWCWTALATWVTAQTGGSHALAPLLAAVVGFEALARERREELTKTLFRSRDSAGDAITKRAWARRHRLALLPSTVEVEAFGLFLVPVFAGRPSILAAVLWLCAMAYGAKAIVHWKYIASHLKTADAHIATPVGEST